MKFCRKILSSETDLSGFDCSIDDELGLNDFIHNNALKYQQEGMGVTHLFYDGVKIVGYITLSMHSIRTAFVDLPTPIDMYPKVNYPALYLGRLAVDNTERRKGIARYMINYCMVLAREKAKEELGCRVIVLVTKKYRVEFYKHFSFKVSNEKLKDNYKLMFYVLDLS